jgi:hypothetical protein
VQRGAVRPAFRDRSPRISHFVLGESNLEKNIDVAAQEVRDQINRVLSEMPEGTRTPEVQKMDPAASPVLYIAVRSDRPLLEATEFADKKIERQLEGINGVGEVSLVGGRKRQINVWADPEALRSYGLTAKDVQSAIARQNASVPGGIVKSGPVDQTLRVKGRVESPAELAAITIKQVGDRSIRVSDVARVEDGAEEQSTIATVNGEWTLLLTVRKQSGQNTVDVVDAVLALVDGKNPTAQPKPGSGGNRRLVQLFSAHEGQTTSSRTICEPVPPGSSYNFGFPSTMRTPAALRYGCSTRCVSTTRRRAGVRGGTTARQRSQRYIGAGHADLRGGQPPERAPTRSGRRSEATNLAEEPDAQLTPSRERVRPSLWEWHREGACRARATDRIGSVAHPTRSAQATPRRKCAGEPDDRTEV